LTDHDTILPEDVTQVAAVDGGEDELTSAARAGLTLADVSRSYARRVLERHRGNKAAAARALDIDRRTLYRMLGDGAADGEGDEAVDGYPDVRG
jgi:ActR/RegA family two-component response regulator